MNQHPHRADESGHHDDGHTHSQGHRHSHSHGGGIRGVLAAAFRPHTHDAADRIDPALAAGAEGMHAVKISLAGLGLTAAIQLVLVLATSSVALLADAVHNVGHALTARTAGSAAM